MNMISEVKEYSYFNLMDTIKKIRGANDIYCNEATNYVLNLIKTIKYLFFVNYVLNLLKIIKYLFFVNVT